MKNADLYKIFEKVMRDTPQLLLERTSYMVIEEKQLTGMLQYSVMRLNYVMAESVEAAIDLLIFCKEMRYNIMPYIRICFNHILNGNSFVDTIKIYELFDCLEDWELDEMAEFFTRRYFYIIVKFPNLAKKIAQLYRNSDRKNAFLDVVKEYGKNNPGDTKYVTSLEQLWTS